MDFIVAEKHSIPWIISWACHLINGILREGDGVLMEGQPKGSVEVHRSQQQSHGTFGRGLEQVMGMDPKSAL